MDHLTLQEKGSAGQVWPAPGMSQLLTKARGGLVRLSVLPRAAPVGALAQALPLLLSRYRVGSLVSPAVEADLIPSPGI